MPDTQRPSDWILPDHIKVTKLDYFGKSYEAYVRVDRRPDLGKAWKQFSDDFRNQETKDITGCSGSYSPNMEQIEMTETKTDEI